MTCTVRPEGGRIALMYRAAVSRGRSARLKVRGSNALRCLHVLLESSRSSKNQHMTESVQRFHQAFLVRTHRVRVRTHAPPLQIDRGGPATVNARP